MSAIESSVSNTDRPGESENPKFAKNFQQFLDSRDAEPVSTSPKRAEWTTARDAILQDFLYKGMPLEVAVDLTDLFVYNKSRDTDRVCPACRWVYKVGQRKGAPAIVVKEQALSGICSLECFRDLNGGDIQTPAQEGATKSTDLGVTDGTQYGPGSYPFASSVSSLEDVELKEELRNQQAGRQPNRLQNNDKFHQWQISPSCTLQRKSSLESFHHVHF